MQWLSIVDSLEFCDTGMASWDTSDDECWDMERKASRYVNQSGGLSKS